MVNRARSFLEMLKDDSWDGKTRSFRFLQVTPTLLFLVGTEIPEHYHPYEHIDELWYILPSSPGVEIRWREAGAYNESYMTERLQPGEFLYLPAHCIRGARSLSGVEFQMLANLSAPSSRLPIENPRRFGNLK